MQYLGGKSKIADEIAAFIAGREPAARFVWDAFCGGLSCAEAFARRGFLVTATDENLALITLYQAWSKGWRAPYVDKDVWLWAREQPDTHPLKAFAGFGLSFGARWFAGFVNKEHMKKNQSAQRVLDRQVPLVRGGFYHVDFLTVEPSHEPDTVLYLDPPYANTTGYRQGSFDSALFWRRADAWHDAGNAVYVSEYNAPDHWSVIWEKTVLSTVSLDKSKKERTEKLFSRKG